MNTISIGEAVSFGWQTFKKRPWYLIGAPLLAVIVYALLSGALTEVAKLGAAIAVLAFVVHIALQVIYAIGLVNFVLKAEQDVMSVTLKDFWNPAPFWRFIGMSLLLFLFVIMGLVVIGVCAGVIAGLLYLVIGSSAWIAFFALGGIAAFIGMLFCIAALFPARYMIVDQAMGPLETIKKSVAITKGHRGKILLFFLTAIGITLLGVIALIVGLAVALPVTMLASVHFYRKLMTTVPATIA